MTLRSEGERQRVKKKEGRDRGVQEINRGCEASGELRNTQRGRDGEEPTAWASQGQALGDRAAKGSCPDLSPGTSGPARKHASFQLPSPLISYSLFHSLSAFLSPILEMTSLPLISLLLSQGRLLSLTEVPSAPGVMPISQMEKLRPHKGKGCLEGRTPPHPSLFTTRQLHTPGPTL